MSEKSNHEKLMLFAPIPSSSVVFSIFGPPGAGKTTVCRRLADCLNAISFSASGFLVQVMDESFDDALKNRIHRNFKDGTNIDDDDIHALVLSELRRSNARTILLDGYPRTMKGAMRISEWAKSEDKKLAGIHVYASKEVCRRRFLAKSYNGNDDKIFDERMKHYTHVERSVIQEHFSNFTININSE
jgi:adenylate kinase family enzyme